MVNATYIVTINTPTDSLLLVYFLELRYTEHIEGELFVKSLTLTLPDFSQKIFFKSDFGSMHPFT